MYNLDLFTLIIIGKSVISSRSAATSLRCILDSKLNMSQHVSRVCKSANYYLHCIRKIRNCISTDVCKLLVHTLVMVRLDCCNALLCGARKDVIGQLDDSKGKLPELCVGNRKMIII